MRHHFVFRLVRSVRGFRGKYGDLQQSAACCFACLYTPDISKGKSVNVSLKSILQAQWHMRQENVCSLAFERRPVRVCKSHVTCTTSAPVYSQLYMLNSCYRVAHEKPARRLVEQLWRRSRTMYRNSLYINYQLVALMFELLRTETPYVTNQ